MALEFKRVFEQVIRMGAMIDAIDFDLTDRLQLALERFAAAGDLEPVRERIDFVRGPEISGYRGAAPLDGDNAETINWIFPPPPSPERATIIAADGSQIYPDEQSPIHYYLLNVGMFIFHHGTDHLPETISFPHLAFHKSEVHDAQKRLVSNRTVDARRTLEEMRQLAAMAWNYRHSGLPVVTLYDNNLLFWAANDVTDSDQIMREYQAALVQLHDSGAILGGYVDNPHRSRVVLRLLFLMSMKDQEEVKRRQKEIPFCGDMEGLSDRHLFRAVLRPGERSAVMVQNSPRNLLYKRRGVSYEIAFFYVKVGTWEQSNIARVDIPAWVTRIPGGVDCIHALLLEQCQMQGRNPYPYALTRADELARVTGRDKQQLEEMINLELRKKGIDPRAISAKSRGKLLAHSEKRPYELRTDLR
ncbi:MAG: DNA double-strand break repair nuclease NurA [bacterium]|nr:DNA double-strand break repair nuclease NurA [bacterium]